CIHPRPDANENYIRPVAWLQWFFTQEHEEGSFVGTLWASMYLPIENYPILLILHEKATSIFVP
ncbi:MAG: hypothetical protein RR505_14355, partial [Raoultibacter sp.]